jgi:heat shock protein HtpX
MALAAGLPMPRVAIVETDALNAFATGTSPDHAAIAVTRGLLTALTRDELQGVVAHEMGHVANNDVLYMTAVGVLVGLIVVVNDLALRTARFMTGGSSSRRSKNGGLVVVAVLVLVAIGLLSPLAARAVQMAVSRQREFLADATSVKLTRNPLGLIGALRKLDQATVRWDTASKAVQHLFIVNPFKKFGEKASALMATHPSIEQRIQRLQALG